MLITPNSLPGYPALFQTSVSTCQWDFPSRCSQTLKTRQPPEGKPLYSPHQVMAMPSSQSQSQRPRRPFPSPRVPTSTLQILLLSVSDLTPPAPLTPATLVLRMSFLLSGVTSSLFSGSGSDRTCLTGWLRGIECLLNTKQQFLLSSIKYTPI